jgi:pyruvate formate lyase activating enzyme
VDLKSFSDEHYREVCQGRLKPVLKSIENMKKHGIWVEVTTLVIPGQNDSESQLAGIAGFLADIDPGIPWHLSRFHPDYQQTGIGPTPLETLERAEQIGRDAGLNHVYLGNVPTDSATYCPDCQARLLTRRGGEGRLEEGACPQCGREIPGVWS